MSHARVLNLSNHPAPPYVRIDRNTMWGNPFHIGRDGDRATVIEKCEKHVRDNIHLMALIELGEFRDPQNRPLPVACHCAPLPCHGEVLVAIDEEFHGRS